MMVLNLHQEQRLLDMLFRPLGGGLLAHVPQPSGSQPPNYHLHNFRHEGAWQEGG